MTKVMLVVDMILEHWVEVGNKLTPLEMSANHLLFSKIVIARRGLATPWMDKIKKNLRIFRG